MTDPNVLLVVLDSVRARNTSVHGHHHDTTPALASLASEATTYTQARAPDRWSLPSHVSLFTGLAPPEHGITAKGDRLEAGHSVFATLAGDGYETGLFSENPFLTELETGLADGFDTVEGKSAEPLFPSATNPNEFRGDPAGFLRAAVGSGRPVRSLLNGVTTKLAWDYPSLLPDRLARRTAGGVSRGSQFTELFLEWVDGRDGPWAACINYMDAHHPYAPGVEYDNWADESIARAVEAVDPYPGGFYTEPDAMWRCEVAEFLYDGTVRQVDHEVGWLVDALRRRGCLEETLLVVTADHGEGFGEPSQHRPVRIAGHAVGGHEANFHVPLVVKYPGQQRARRVTDPVSLTEFPAVVEAVRGGRAADTPDPFVSGGPVVAVASEPDAEFLERLRDAGVDTSPFEGDVEVVYEPADDGAVRKRMRWGDECATVRVPDAHTVVPVADTDEDVVQSTFESFDRADVADCGAADSVDEATKRRLDQLGYR